MKCKNCGGILEFQNGIAICGACGSTYNLNHVFEDIDVHICYVENDLCGRRTKDSIVAQEIYQKLEAKKIKVFFERISATNVIGDDMEMLRYSSISAAKIILVVGTSADNFNLILEKYGEYMSGKTVIPFVSDIKPSDIPKELGKIQAIDFASIGWERDLEKGIFQILGREKEFDMMDSHNKSKKMRNIILVIVATVIIVCSMCFFFFFNNSKESEDYIQQSSQDIYSNAIDLVIDGHYLDAYDLFSGIQDYKDSQKQIESIFNQYDGYYQSHDKKFSVYFNIKNASQLSIEMSTVSSNGTAKAIVDGVWNGKEQSYSFVDTFGNAGMVTVTLRNDGLLTEVQMENIGDFASIGNQKVEFKLSDKTDKPEILQVTPDLLLSWLEKPTTTDDITSLGFELEKDNNSKVIIGSATMEKANHYRIANTDIQLFFYAKDLSNKKVLYENDNDTKKQILCAMIADAEYLIPNKIGDKCQMYIEDNVFFAPGGKKMDIDWGGSDVYILFYTGKYRTYSPKGTIKAGTKVGAFCRKIVGTGFFVRNVIMHKDLAEGIQRQYGPFIAEKKDCYIIGDLYEYEKAYIVNKKTYRIIDETSVCKW